MNTRMAFVVLLATPVVALATLGCGAGEFRSPDGKFEATLVRPEPAAVHYQVKEVATGHVVLVTHGEYPTPNDVKAARFSKDSTRFAAAYHYGHLPGQPYTWIGVWRLSDGKLVREERLDGFQTTIPDSVFLEASPVKGRGTADE